MEVWTTLPDRAFSKLLDNCNFEAIVTLRKVCTHFRHFIDESISCDLPLLKTSLDWLVINVSPESVKITFTNIGALFHEQIAVDYLKSENGCTVAWKENFQWKTKKIDNKDWVTVALRDLEIYLKLLEKSILPHLSVHYYFSDSEKMGEKFQNGFWKILNPRILRVEDLDLNVSDTAQIVEILPFLAPGILKRVTVARQQMTDSETDSVLEIKKIMDLEQIKKLEELIIRGFILSKPIREFYYLPKMVLQVKEVTVDQILESKKDFNRYPHLKRFVMDCDKIWSYEEAWLQKFGSFHEDRPENEYDRKRWFFRIPEDPENILELEFSQNMLIFTRISTFDAPKNAIIID